MDDLDYQRLCTWIEKQHVAAVAALQRTYDEHRLALNSIRDQLQAQRSFSPVPRLFRKQHGNLIEAVRESAGRVGRTFTLQDVERILRTEHPLLMAQSSRKSISTALRRLYGARELVLVEEGRGTKPARYAPVTSLLDSGESRS